MWCVHAGASTGCVVLLDTATWTAAHQWLLPCSLAALGFLPGGEGERLTTTTSSSGAAGAAFGAEEGGLYGGLYAALQLRLYAAISSEKPMLLQVRVCL